MKTKCRAPTPTDIYLGQTASLILESLLRPLDAGTRAADQKLHVARIAAVAPHQFQRPLVRELDRGGGQVAGEDDTERQSELVCGFRGAGQAMSWGGLVK